MSSKALTYITLAVTILAACTPVVGVLTTSGFPVAAHIVSLVISVAGAIKLALDSSVLDAQRIQGAAQVPGAPVKLAAELAKKRMPSMGPVTGCLCLSIACVLYLTAMMGCTPAEVNGAQKVLSVEQSICTDVALASSVIPPGTAVATVAKDLEAVCDLSTLAETDIETIVAGFMAGQAAQGTAPPAGTPYHPPARVRAKVVR